ncbi:flagellar motor switch phosphatase FliY [Planococcus shixiaomingii]|uniref:flagellar motor switch phosphatase FliY n=1 Tax=Planococcus shixiaomingii TaxID=3058393 RepID=UPI00262F92BF|nr:flagellar motor switch phosphatase FliY [Planococcus sp. N022]WKA53905.1 flagellar motor switch phosphatase FliY [Planococcus sp. N022]
MTTEKLSSDEISGLLGKQGTEEKKMSKNSLSALEKEAMTELLTVSLGGASAVLSLMFSEQVTVKAPKLSVLQKDKLMIGNETPFFVVLGEYTGGITGLQFLSINKKDVQTITRLVDDQSDMEDMEKQFEVIQEMVQQMFMSATRSMTTILEQDIAHSLSGMDIIENQQEFPINKFTKEEWFVEAAFQMQIGSETQLSFHLYLPIRLAQHIVNILTDTMNEENPEETQQMEFQSNNPTNNSTNQINTNTSPNIQSVQFSSFDETVSAQAEPNNLNMLLDIPLQVTVELGRTKRMVKEILGVSQGSIIELDKLAGEPVDILINNKLIAVGEVVVIDENFGVRVTDIISTADRISKLR